MKNLKSTFALLLAGTVIISACKKDDDDTDDRINNNAIAVDTNLIVNIPWKLKSVYYVDNNGKQDFSSSIHPCEWDNLLYFQSGGNVKVEEGDIECDSTDAIFTKGGNWFIDRENRTLTITNDTDVQSFNISDLNDTSMTVFGRVKVKPFEVDAEVTFIEDDY